MGHVKNVKGPSSHKKNPLTSTTQYQVDFSSIKFKVHKSTLRKKNLLHICETSFNPLIY